MKFVRRILLGLLFAVSLPMAKDFMGIPIEDPVREQNRELPTWILGGGGFLSYYLNSIDGGIELSADRRLGVHHSLGTSGHLFFGNDLIDIGLDYRFYFMGSLMSGHDDFLRATFAAMFMEKNGKSYVSPLAVIGYGRDVLFFKTANLVGRIDVHCGYLLGETLAKKSSDDSNNYPGHFLVYLNFSLLFF
ncbi:MAG: hypothetical protein MJY82_01545 [Fibrobacter sp.]|nr:hypothetical protein [Fibrobacter sp.]